MLNGKVFRKTDRKKIGTGWRTYNSREKRFHNLDAGAAALSHRLGAVTEFNIGRVCRWHSTSHDKPDDDGNGDLGPASCGIL